MNKKAFTLIEVLVVVLIIGILAAIAMPKYQLAVDKAQFSNLQSLARSIKSAYDAYYFSTGEYPDSFDKLDIDFSSAYQRTSSNKESCIIFQDSYCCVGKYVENNQHANIVCGKNDYSFAFDYRFAPEYSRCVFANQNDRAKRLCKNLRNDPNIYTYRNLIYPQGHYTNDGKQYSMYNL